MEKDCECYDEEVQPYRKTDYKPIIYILYQFYLANLMRKSYILNIVNSIANMIGEAVT